MAAAKLPSQDQPADLLRLTTAGSVDDGKSTLIGRLLYEAKYLYEDQFASVVKASQNLNREGVDLAMITDGLRAEREQGITIDVAYRSFATPRRRFIIADTPGHEQYTRNMVTGASTAELAIILLDASQGVLTQSKRHGFIASLLGVPHVVVAVNKMDLVGYSEEVFERIVAAYNEFAARLSIIDLVYIPVCALKGDNVVEKSARMPWYLGMPLLAHLENVHTGSTRNLVDFRFAVQYVNYPRSDFRGYCGQVASGVVRVGDEVLVLPSGKASRVKAIDSFDGPLESAFPPLAVSISLEDDLDVGRGDMLVHPRNLPKVHHELEAMLVWMDQEPFRLHKPYLVKHTTNWVKAHFTQLVYRVNPEGLHREAAEELLLNEIGRVTLQLFRSVAFDEYKHNRSTGGFIVVDPMSNHTVGAGMIIDRSLHRGEGRAFSAEGRVSGNVMKHESRVEPGKRRRLLGQKACTLWLTGLSGAGKSTLAYELEKRLLDAGHISYVLDGDNVRQGLNRDLGFSPADRSENIRRIAEAARLMNEAGLIVITAFISPYRQDRQRARAIIGEPFIEVFVDAPLAVCEERDPRNLYRRARSGEIPEFTGVTAPYEAPENPDVHLSTDRLDIEQAVQALLTYLHRKEFLTPARGE